MPSKPKILLVDDDGDFRAIVAAVLAQNGFRVIECADGDEAPELIFEQRPALVLLDVHMRRWGGWRTLKELRRRGSAMPIVMLTSAADELSRVQGLDLGADDYIVKPCSLPELLARVRALLRRCPPQRLIKRLRIGDVVVDLAASTATRGNTAVPLTRKEFDLLELLARNVGRPVSRATLLHEIWGVADAPNSHTLDTHLWRLRQKIGTDGGEWLSNRQGIGYVLHCDIDPQP